MVNEKLDLIILTRSLKCGGAEVIALNLIEYLPHFISKEIIVRHQQNSSNKNHSKNIASSVSIINCIARKLPRSIKSILSIFYESPDIIKYIYTLRKKRPSVSLSISCSDNFINVISSLFSKTKPILSCHYMPSQYNVCGGYIMNKLTYVIARFSRAHIIAVSNSVAEELHIHYNIPKKQLHTIQNPIDLEKIQIKSADDILDSRVNLSIPLIVTVGRLNAVKGQWHLIRTFAEFRRKQECQLLICGEGAEKEYLSELIRDLGIENDVVFLGWQENPYKYMKKSTVFIQSSLSEALPNVLVESMACGCPIVAAGCSGGIEEILGPDNKCGFIVGKMSGVRYSAEDALDEGEMDLYDAMLRVIEDVILRTDMSEACKERAKMFDLDIGMKRYVELIEKVRNSM